MKLFVGGVELPYAGPSHREDNVNNNSPSPKSCTTTACNYTGRKKNNNTKNSFCGCCLTSDPPARPFLLTGPDVRGATSETPTALPPFSNYLPLQMQSLALIVIFATAQQEIKWKCQMVNNANTLPLSHTHIQCSLTRGALMQFEFPFV